MPARHRLISLVCVPALSLLAVGTARAMGYAASIAEAEQYLHTGDAAQALTLSQSAIRMRPRRWEAYLVAGGALQLEHEYAQAIDDFTAALQRSPEAKREAVSGVLNRCIQAQSAAFTETMAWLKANIPGGATGSGDQRFAQSLNYGNDRFKMVDGRKVPNPLPECQAGLLSVSSVNGAPVILMLTIHFSQLEKDGVWVRSFGQGYQEISGLTSVPPTQNAWATIIVTNDNERASHIAAALNHAIDICRHDN